MPDYVIQNGELYHHGVKGMKWGVRKKSNSYATRAVRGHAGPGRYIGEKRKIAGAKKDLEILNSGGHLSVGLTKKRQAALDARDRKLLNETLAKEPGVSKRTARLQAKVEKQKKIVDARKDIPSMERLAKLEYKTAISQKRDQINAGASAVGRLWNKLTDADKYQAEIEYALERQARIDKARRDEN